MGDTPFSERTLEVLLHPQHWALVSSVCPPDMPAVHDERHAAWMREHSHDHPMREILIALTDGGTQGYQGRCYRRRRGGVFCFAAHEAHDCYVPAWTPDEDQLWLFLGGSEVVCHLVQIRAGEAQPSEWRLVLSQERLPLEVSALFGVGGDSLPAALARMRLLSALSLLIAEILTAALQQEPALGDEEDFPQQIVRSIAQHIRDTVGKDLTLDVLAHLSGYSKYHLLRLFKQHTGQTIHAYINDCRAVRVAELLQQRRSMKQIAEMLGFSSPAAFSRWRRSHGA
ncbi:MAG TPA: helix-turn-helix transcriptional regulator [Armatimonadota bacterium]|jgi:AraC-like DNA-binding protein